MAANISDPKRIEELRRIVARVAERELSGNVHEVAVEPGIGWDDNAVLNIMIALNDTSDPDIRKMLGLTGRIRDELNDEGGFPMLSFMSVEDFQRSRSAAA